MRFTLILLLLVGCLARRSFPEPLVRVTAPGLRGEAQIDFDADGVPHVRAPDMDAAAWALGWLHARDRGFQLELLRFVAQGRLSELFGPALLPTDLRYRLLTTGLDEAVGSMGEAEERRALAYCAGINQGMKDTPRPLELRLLKHEPAAWTPRDVLSIGRLQAWGLADDALEEGLRDRLRGTVSEEALARLTAPTPALGASILEPDPGSRPKLPKVPPPPAGLPLRPAAGVSPQGPTAALGAFRSEDALAFAAAFEGAMTGSNGWAVDGAHSTTGSPLLVGDPHLLLTWPPVFYEAHLRTPEIDVSGATFPGLPMVVMGRANSIAWTVTSSFADVQDLYRLELDPADPSVYVVDGQKVPFTEVKQVFQIKGEDPVEVVYRGTRFGPVYNNGREEDLKPGVIYAVSWPGFSAEAPPLVEAFDGLYRSTTPAQVVGSIGRLPYPAQNWVYALQSGDIGYLLGGALPNAAASPFPRDGGRSSSVPSEPPLDARRPNFANPASGRVVTANQPQFADVSLSGTRFWGPYRALRIETALSKKEKWSPDDMRGLQMDTVNLEAARAVPVFLSAVDGRVSDDTAQAMVATLLSWEYQMEADSAAALVYMAWRGALHRRLAALQIPDPALAEDWVAARLTEAPMEAALFTEAGRADWDDPRTPAVETREEAILWALEAARSALVEAHGGAVERWTWGEAHTLTLDHPFAAKRALRPWFGLEPLALPGASTTILAIDEDNAISRYTSTAGPALRQVVTPGGEAGFVLPGGNAGQPGHPYALNQLPDWVDNRQHAAGVWPAAPVLSVKLVPAAD